MARFAQGGPDTSAAAKARDRAPGGRLSGSRSSRIDNASGLRLDGVDHQDIGIALLAVLDGRGGAG